MGAPRQSWCCRLHYIAVTAAGVGMATVFPHARRHRHKTLRHRGPIASFDDGCAGAHAIKVVETSRDSKRADQGACLRRDIQIEIEDSRQEYDAPDGDCGEGTRLPARDSATATESSCRPKDGRYSVSRAV
jgi:hypothetical protein